MNLARPQNVTTNKGHSTQNLTVAQVIKNFDTNYVIRIRVDLLSRSCY